MELIGALVGPDVVDRFVYYWAASLASRLIGDLGDVVGDTGR